MPTIAGQIVSASGICNSDAEGRLRVDGIVPGLSYHIQEDVPPREGPIRVQAGGRLPWYDETRVLVPRDE